MYILVMHTFLTANLCHKTIAIIIQYKNGFDNIHWRLL